MKTEKHPYTRWNRLRLFMRDLSPVSIYSLLEFGIPRRMGTIFTMRKASFSCLDRPVFFLSTGRCGTNWIQKLLSRDRSIKAVHEPQPNLAFQNSFAYTIQKEMSGKKEPDSGRVYAVLQEMFLAGRELYLRYCYKTGRRFVETNHYLTFFAPAIARLIPDALFVHVYRHPGEFVRSALRRGWYTHGNMSSAAFPRPVQEDPCHSRWASFSGIQKNAWLWTETNQFIEAFKNREGSGRVYSFDFSSMNPAAVSDLAAFAGAEISERIIHKHMGQKVNAQKGGSVQVYSRWNDMDKAELQALCADTAAVYGYEL